jgi:hypothetical protein
MKRIDRSSAGLVIAATSVIVAACAFAAMCPSHALASSSLVFRSTDLKTLGLHPTSTSVGAARHQLGIDLPPGALVEASAGRKDNLKLALDAFVLRSASAANRVLAAWRRSRPARSLKLGQAGAIHTRGKRLAEVLWRAGPRLGLIVVSGPKAARNSAISYARLAQSILRRRLPRTAWEAVLDEIGPDGTIAKPTALAAFALAYGPLPGVRPPSGRRTAIPSATLAARSVLAYRSRLTPRQRGVVDRLLGLSAPVRAGRARTADLGDPNFHPTATVQASAESFAGIEAAKLAHPLGLQLVAGNTSTPINGWADALPLNAAGAYGSGAATTCRIRVGPTGQAADPTFRQLVIAHEVFHCFEFAFEGARAWQRQPKWIEEGLADWAALTVDPVSYTIGGGNLTAYIKTSYRPLFSRTYDAVGFWGHVQDSVGTLWARIPVIFTAGGNEIAFRNALANTEPFLNSWGSSVFNATGRSFGWLMMSPMVPPDSVTPDISPLAISQVPSPVFAAPYTTSQYLMQDTDPDAPLVHVSMLGHARLSGRYDYTDLNDAWFCVGADGCQCPPDSIDKIPANRPLLATSELGLSGDPDAGTRGEITGYPLKTFCKPKQAKPPPNHACRVLDDASVSSLVGPGSFQFVSTFRRGAVTVSQCIYVPDSTDSTPSHKDGASLTLTFNPKIKPARLRANVRHLMQLGGFTPTNIGDLAGYLSKDGAPAAVDLVVGRNFAQIAGPHVLTLARNIAAVLR